MKVKAKTRVLVVCNSFHASWRLPENIVLLSVAITVSRAFWKGDAEGLSLLRASCAWGITRRGM